MEWFVQLGSVIYTDKVMWICIMFTILGWYWCSKLKFLHSPTQQYVHLGGKYVYSSHGPEQLAALI